MTLEHGTAYLQSFFVGDNLERFATDRFNEPRRDLVLRADPDRRPAALVDVSAGLCRGGLRRASRSRQRRLTDAEWRLLLWALVPLLFFTISIGKQPRYILPVLPPLAILLARSIATRHDGTARRALLAAATWVTAALYRRAGRAAYRAQPLFITRLSAADAAGAVRHRSLCGVGSGVDRRDAAVGASCRDRGVCAGLFCSRCNSARWPGCVREPVEQMAALVRANRRAGEPVGKYQVFVRNLVFYTRFKQVDLFDEACALDFLKSPDACCSSSAADDLPRLESIAGVTARKLGEVQYLNAANIRLRTLLSPIPEQDLETSAR